MSPTRNPANAEAGKPEDWRMNGGLRNTITGVVLGALFTCLGFIISEIRSNTLKVQSAIDRIQTLEKAMDRTGGINVTRPH